MCQKMTYLHDYIARVDDWIQETTNGYSIGNRCIARLLEHLKQETQLQNLICSKYPVLGKKGFHFLFIGLTVNVSVTKLKIEPSEFNFVKDLNRCLNKNSTFRRLDLMEVSSDLIQDLNLSGNTTLRDLKITCQYGVSLEHLSTLFCSIRESGLERLCLASPGNVEPEVWPLASPPIHHLKSLHLIEIFKYNYRDQLLTLINGLTFNNNLTDLNLSHNSLTDKEGLALRNSLLLNNTLLHLDVSNNQLGNTGHYYLYQALLKNTTLTNLAVYNNSITDIGYVSRMLLINSTLKRLDFNHTRCCLYNGLLYRAVEQNISLTYLHSTNGSKADWYDQSACSNLRERISRRNQETLREKCVRIIKGYDLDYSVIPQILITQFRLEEAS